MKILSATIVSLLCSVAISCSPKVRETGRVGSLDGSLDAIVAEADTDATVATPSEVYVVKRGGGVSGNPVFRADNVDGLDVRWIDRRLIIRASKARVFLKKGSIQVTGVQRPVGVDILVENEVP